MDYFFEGRAELDQLVADRMVTARKHPSLPLIIYNYSVKAQFLPVNQWSDVLSQARGLILDDENSVVGRPFRKFWNYEQVQDKIPAGDFTVWEKLDGSLGIVCFYRGYSVVATRGSFESDQAKWATDFLEKKQNRLEDIEGGYTYLFEIVYPNNRIVVDYQGREDMVLLAVLDKSGAFRDDIFDQWPYSKAQRFDGLKDFAALEQDPRFQGQEGFVLRWSNGYQAKTKFSEYKRLHRLITQCSNRTIWELLAAGKSTDELMDHVPEDFRKWANGIIDDLKASYQSVEECAREDFEDAPKGTERKEFAAYATKRPYPGLLFSLMDGKPMSAAIWKLIEPKWARPFRVEDEA